MLRVLTRAAMHTLGPFCPRCFLVGLSILAMGVVLEIFHTDRAAVVLGFDVAAMSLLTAGVLGVRGLAAARVCAFWASSGAVLETLQHSRAVAWLLPRLPEEGIAGGLADLASLFLVNGKFTPAEIVGAIAGACVGFLLIHQIVGDGSHAHH